MTKNSIIQDGMTIKLDWQSLPDYPTFVKGSRRAPKRSLKKALTPKEDRLAVANVLRYVPENYHEELIPEFLEELRSKGRIYAYRFRPAGRIYGKSIEEYTGVSQVGRALQVMIDNNLDFETALYPYELVTYGESGQVFQNWLQYLLVKKYLENITETQTLVVSSGHPLGLFPSPKTAPRVIITNGLLVGNWDNEKSFDKLAALGVTNYGQMTAGGWMYIGPQGIVHGTYITILNAGRKYLGLSNQENLKGRVFVSSGLGGMSGAQPKAVKIAGGIAVIAEVDETKIRNLEERGWIDASTDSLEKMATLIGEYRLSKEPVAIAYHGNVVDLLEYCDKYNVHIDLLSDQTSCHVVYKGGYTPVGLSFAEGRNMLNAGQDEEFRDLVNNSLKRHYEVIRRLEVKGVHFWDYGNSFMASVLDSGIKEIARNGQNDNDGFIWKSYVEDIMGPLCFDKGFGPFRWVCLSGDPHDLRKTDEITRKQIDPTLSAIHNDNFNWIAEAGQNDLVRGTQARILYADEQGRVDIALAFNQAIRRGEIGPVMMGRDHHDVSGTDSPYRETADINDGSRFTADMSVQCFAGNIARGMTMVVLSNGGGVGVSRASNGGNGILLDGSLTTDEIITSGLSWDVMGGVARRSWSGNQGALETALAWNNKQDNGQITLPFLVDEKLLNSFF